MPGKKPPRVIVTGESGQDYPQAKKKRIRHEEIHVHRPIVRVLHQIEGYTGLLTFFHVPNQLLRRSAMRKIFHALGVRSGVPDLCIAIRGGVAIWLELKYNGNGLSGDQDDYLEGLRKLGHIVEIIDAKDAHDALNQLYAVLAKHGLEDFKWVHEKDRV